jgi:hypothetical protein
MEFLYRGFTQTGNARSYWFDAVEAGQPAKQCCVCIELALFTRNQLSLQSGPQFCLQLLRAGCQADPRRVGEFQSYNAVESDFASLRSERAAQAEAAAHKRPPRRPPPKPSASSQLKYFPPDVNRH